MLLPQLGADVGGWNYYYIAVSNRPLLLPFLEKTKYTAMVKIGLTLMITDFSWPFLNSFLSSASVITTLFHLKIGKDRQMLSIRSTLKIMNNSTGLVTLVYNQQLPFISHFQASYVSCLSQTTTRTPS